MNREHLDPAGPIRDSQSPTRTASNASPTRISSLRRPTITDAPMLSASSSNNHSLFSFGGRNNRSDNVNNNGTSDSFDFLPSVSFDDLQTSLESASADFKLTQFPSPTGQGTILGDHALDTMGERLDTTAKRNIASSHSTTSQPALGTRSRAGSLLRRPSTSGRAVGSSTASTSTTTSNPPPISAVTRARRAQSHYPPVSGSHIAKPPRKSTGDVVLGGDIETHRRRGSIASLTDKNGLDLPRTSIDSGSRPLPDAVRAQAGSRTAKARSVQPTARSSQPTLTAETTTLAAPETTHLSTSLPRSPRVVSKTSHPASAKRISVVPGVLPPHATGLGARTISPTDAKRLKRLSMHHSQMTGSNALPNPPPLAASLDRPSSRSPSMLPRKISTPSSSTRTTPDPSRKSYSSGLSANSSSSVNNTVTVRTSTQSLQQRLSLAASRLPTPKVLGLAALGHDLEDEDVPPVPAIPKAFESPRDPLAPAPKLEKRSSNRTFDTSSIHSKSSTSSVSGTQPSETPAHKLQRRPSQRKSIHTSKLDLDTKPIAAPARKTLQPLRLPPLTLNPLNTPTAAKIAALQEQAASSDRDRDNVSPPPTKTIPKTPTTPMTASKSTFFSRRYNDDKFDVQHLRSSSSVHRLRRDTPPPLPEPQSSSESFSAVHEPTPRSGPSPFLSSSVPKGGNVEAAYLKRSKTGGDISVDTTSESPVHQQQHVSHHQHKPSDPRPPKQAAPQPAKSPPPLPSPDEPQTPSSMSSLRRKLSLSWKRNNSKNSSGQIQTEKTSETKTTKHESMPPPPPRIPVSATVGSIPAVPKPPSPTKSSITTSNYLDARRRKSSSSSLHAIMAEQRARGEGLTAAKKDSTLESVAERATALHNSSVVQKILRPKASAPVMKDDDLWVPEYDKEDMLAEEEMRKLGLRRKDTEIAARTLDALRKRATPKERVSPQEAIRIAMLNVYERGEIVDYKDIYFCGTQNANKVVGDVQSNLPNHGYDDERGDYTIVPGDHLAYRYEIIDLLGKGSFGQVVRCIDHKTGVLVAVKIIRNKKRFHQQALVEVNILQKLREWDPHNKHSMVNFTHSFYFRGHLCISTELLDMNLYEFIKANSFRGFSLRLIRRFTKQILSALNLLKKHRVIHCDLKPENILLRHPLHTEIKVIDFGSSCFEDEKVYTYIQSRFYRSPEVILGMTYGLPIDMWSLGCILAELYTGVPIFPGENEQEQLACIMEVFGPPEKHLIEKSTRRKLFFDSMGKPRLTVSSKGRRRRPSSKTLQQVLKCDDEAFLDFIARCLRWDPERRMTPEQAIHHEFITGVKPSIPRTLSPAKRVPSLTSTHGPRPLPEPPTPAKPSTLSHRMREQKDEKEGSKHQHTGSGSSTGPGPLKPAVISSSSSRRVSGMTATTIGTSGTVGTISGTTLVGSNSVKRTPSHTFHTSHHTHNSSSSTGSLASTGGITSVPSNSSLPRASLRNAGGGLSTSASVQTLNGGSSSSGATATRGHDLAAAGASAAMGMTGTAALGRRA